MKLHLIKNDSASASTSTEAEGSNVYEELKNKNFVGIYYDKKNGIYGWLSHNLSHHEIVYGIELLKQELINQYLGL